MNTNYTDPPEGLAKEVHATWYEIVGEMVAAGTWRDTYAHAIEGYCRALYICRKLEAEIIGHDLVNTGGNKVHPAVRMLLGWEQLLKKHAYALRLNPRSSEALRGTSLTLQRAGGTISAAADGRKPGGSSTRRRRTPDKDSGPGGKA